MSFIYLCSVTGLPPSLCLPTTSFRSCHLLTLFLLHNPSVFLCSFTFFPITLFYQLFDGALSPDSVLVSSFPRSPNRSYHSFTFLPQPTPLPSKPVLPRLLCPSKLHSYVWIDINVLQFQTEIYVLYFLGFFCHCCLGTMG